MTNFQIKAIILAASAIMFTLAGCKKDKDTSYAFTLDVSSLDFEWGQTKEVGVKILNIRSFDTITATEGWSCVRNGNTYIITAPGQQSGNTSGTIEVSATSYSGISLTRKITVSVKLADEITTMANSVIVSEPGKRFKFNASRRGNETNESITGATSATRVWATATNVVVNVSLENGYLYFATGDGEELTEGNAVVAVTNKDGNILWSWHIWVTDYDPAADPDLLNDFRVMNRNMGALANSNASPEEVVRSYGLYYQWGRKDPFIGPAAWNLTSPITIYTDQNRAGTHIYEVATAETGTVEYAIARPGTFIAGASKDNGFDWIFSGRKTDLWSPSSKTVYDPCPAGWRVAPPTIWRGFTTTGNASDDRTDFNVEGEYEYGWTFSIGDETIFFPAAGRRSFSPSLAKPEDNFTNVVNNGEGVGFPVGFYWSGAYPVPSDAAALPNGASLVFRHDYIDPAYLANDIAGYAPAGGFPLRCVAE